MRKWQEHCEERVLGDQPERRLHHFLKSSIPRFRAPTDVAAWRRRAAVLRRQALAKVYLRGYPADILKTAPRVKWGPTLAPHPDYVVRKLRYEAYPNYWVPALLYQPTKMTGKAPVVLNANGHHRGGKACHYKQARCINLAKRGMLALNFEFIGMSELEADVPHSDFALLDLTGMAGVGLFYLAMSKGLDVLLDQPHADPKRVCMTGLSGGGWQTIVLSALDKRITVCVPAAGYTAIRARVGCNSDIGDLEQAPVDLTTVMDYQDMTAMLAPRPTLQILNENDDCCFKAAATQPIIFDAIKPTFAAFGAADSFACHRNQDPGTHNYAADNRSQLYRFLNRHFALETPETDLPFESELLDESATLVGLPARQATVRGIAYERARALARQHQAPRTSAQRRQLRRALASAIRLPQYQARAKLAHGDKENAAWVLATGGLRLPVTGKVKAGGRSAALIINDGGRAACGGCDASVKGSLFAADVLGTGETRFDTPHLMVAECAGHRLLGIRVAQTLAAADFVARQTGVERLDLLAVGVNCGITAALAVALRPERFQSLLANEMPSSYLRLYEWCRGYADSQLSMCFGLLEVADIPQVLALMEGVAFRQPGRETSPRQIGA